MTDFYKTNCEIDIKFYRKMFRSQFLWVMFNLSVTCFDASSLLITPTVWTGAAFGAMAITTIWTLVFLFEAWGDLRNSKLKYKFLTELHDIQMASNERKHYEMARKNYEELIENLKGKQNDRSSEPSTTL